MASLLAGPLAAAEILMQLQTETDKADRMTRQLSTILPGFLLAARSCWAWERPRPGRGLAALRMGSWLRPEAGWPGLAWAG